MISKRIGALDIRNNAQRGDSRARAAISMHIRVIVSREAGLQSAPSLSLSLGDSCHIADLRIKCSRLTYPNMHDIEVKTQTMT